VSKGPSEVFIINLFKYNENEREKRKKKEEFYNNQKMELIQGALTIADKIIKFNFDKIENIDFDQNYFCVKILEESLKIYLKKEEPHIIKRCLNCFCSILLKYPKCIIENLPKIILRLSDSGLSGKTESLVYQLNTFFQNCNSLFQKAFDENNNVLIQKIIKITKDNSMIRAIVLLNPFIFKLKDLKPSNGKPLNEKMSASIQTLINNYYIFCTTLVYNNLILNNYIVTIYIEVIIIYFIEKSSQDLVRKYIVKIITKIFKDKLLKRVFNYLLVDDKGNLKLKNLFYILRSISSDKYNKNNLPLLIKFLEKNNKINKSSSSKILEFLAKHLINKETKFYFVDFYKDNLNNTASNDFT
jgi:hypothetical protein